jgi:hypothetical protein
VTVFTGIIMPVIIGACVLLSDLCLYDSGGRIIKRSIDASAYSILGKYSGYLKDNYGIYAFILDNDRAWMIAADNLLNNLGDSNIYDFKIKNLEIRADKPIANPGVMIGAVKKAMTDDIYKSLADEFMDKFDILSKMTGAAEIINMKMQIDKAYKKIKDGMTAVNKMINGDTDIEYYVNMAGLDSEFASAVKRFNEYIAELSEIEKQINDIFKLISEKPDEKAGIIILLEEKAGQLREKAADAYISYIEGFIHGLKDANRKAVSHIQDIFTENNNIHMISDAIGKRISKIEDCPVYLKELLNACTRIVSDVEEAFVEQVFEEIRIKLEGNISMLTGLEKVFLKAVENAGGAAAVETGELFDEYNYKINLDMPEDIRPGKDEDRRTFFEELGKKVLQKQFGEDISIPEWVVLPSSAYDVDSTGFSATSKGEDTMTGEAEINKISRVVNVPGSGMLENLSVNEYILHHFIYENSYGDNNQADSFFNNEVEYILWGAKSRNTNIFYTKAALMSTRFALDAIHVYTDSEKIAKADALAAATAGWWTMGAGIPVMANLIKISWAIAEAGFDTRKLWNGEEIPLIKTAGDWITDIGLNKAVPSHGLLTMDYGDYLRLYLLALPIEKKAARMLDIISLNAPGYFNIYDAFTEITVTAVVSYRSLTGGRHEMESTATISY